MLQCYKTDFEIQLLNLLEPVADRHGFGLVDLDWNAGNRLTVFVEPKKNPREMSVEACVELSEIFSRVLDVEDPIQSKYSLEVSSPGLERPLRTVEHFRNLKGLNVKIKLLKSHPLQIEGRVPQYNLVGTIMEVNPSGLITMNQMIGNENVGDCRFSIHHLEKAHLFLTEEEIFQNH